MATYEKEKFAAPVLKGFALRTFVSALESGVGNVLLGKLLADNGFERFRDADPGHATPVQVALPWPANAPAAKAPEAMAEAATQLPRVGKGPALETVAALAQAYRSGATTPTQVAQQLEQHIAALDEGPSRMAFFIARKPDEVAKAAAESSARLEQGAPRSVLEGVPVVVKDELDLAGFPTTLGTSFLKTPATHDATIVARLKAAGAVVLGKANMHEIGIAPIGINPHHGACRNPWDRSRITGGSSSGSAATVAAGLAPISIGADGGGSIRIPAALCGLVGLKATWGRISEAGIPPLCWNVGHAGPLGLTVADVAAAYAIIAGPDPRDSYTARQPAVELEGLGNASLEGLRLGVCRAWFEDAEPSVVKQSQAALDALVSAGAKVVDIPAPDQAVVRWAHSVIIAAEMFSAMAPHVRHDRTRFGLDVRTNLRIGESFHGHELVHAMRHRTRLTHEWLEMMKTVDAVVTPTTGCTAPAIPEAALPDGESNLPVLDALMRFVRISNLTGFPAMSVPAGYDERGLPVGVQLIARPYEESLLFRLGRVVEAHFERRVPSVHVGVL